MAKGKRKRRKMRANSTSLTLKCKIWSSHAPLSIYLPFLNEATATNYKCFKKNAPQIYHLTIYISTLHRTNNWKGFLIIFIIIQLTSNIQIHLISEHTKLSLVSVHYYCHEKKIPKNLCKSTMIGCNPLCLGQWQNKNDLFSCMSACLCVTRNVL